MVRSGDMADRQAERTPSYWAVLAAAFVVTAAPAAFAQTAPEPPRVAPPPAPLPAPAPPVPVEQLVVLEADAIINDERAQTVTAEGNVEVRHEGRTLKADRLVYDLNTANIHATGNVEIVNADGSVQYAEEVQVDENLNVGIATELRARFGEQGSLAARSVVRYSENENELRNVVYTSCPICETGDRPPTWALKARSARQDDESRTIAYQNMVMEVVGVPVLYLPYFGHPDPSAGRASGLLIPDAGRNRRLGAFYEQAYYWAISPSQDLSIGGRVHEQVNPLLGLNYRKRFWSGDLEIDTAFTQEQDFDGDGEKFGEDKFRYSLFAEGLFRINDYWRWGFGAERIHDEDDFNFLRRYDIEGTGERRGPYIGDSRRLISQLYAIGQDSTSYSSVSFVDFQGLRSSDTNNLLPVILPFAETEHVFRDPLLDGQIRLKANTAVLVREEDIATPTLDRDSARVSFDAIWRNDVMFGPGIVLSPFLQAREDIFHVETAEEEFETFDRTAALGGAEISWPFMRAGESVDIVVEPVAMASWGTTDADDSRVINEDSLAFELDDSNLFRPNAAPNYDLWEPGARVSAGVRATARAVTGQSASLTFGRRWRSEAAEGFTERNNLEGRATDWVGAVSTDFGRNFGTEVRFRLEDESFKLQRLDADVRAAIGRFSAHARYYSIDRDTYGLPVCDPNLAACDPASEIAGEIGVELVGGWRTQLGLRRDLDNDINVRQELRLIYEDDCSFLEIAYTRSETRSGLLGPNEGLQIRIGLRSLGVLGGGE